MIALTRRLEPPPTAPAVRPAPLLDNLELGYLLAGFRGLLPLDSSVHAPLRQMLEETLGHPGSLVRAQLAYLLLRDTTLGRGAARELAVALEYFHTASLIFDDMPMMDDSLKRRGRTCPHLEYSEATATLGALALINQGYALLWRVLAGIPRSRSGRAAELVARSLGAAGILSGQSRDLDFEASSAGETEIVEVADGKTGSLLRLTLVLPAVVGGASERTVTWLERLATVWGFAYQGLDDCKDIVASRFETGKTTSRDGRLGRPNLCSSLGLARTVDRLRELVGEAAELLAAPPTEEWPELARLQEVLEAELARAESRIGERLVGVPINLTSS